MSHGLVLPMYMSLSSLEIYPGGYPWTFMIGASVESFPWTLR